MQYHLVVITPVGGWVTFSYWRTLPRQLCFASLLWMWYQKLMLGPTHASYSIARWSRFGERSLGWRLRKGISTSCSIAVFSELSTPACLFWAGSGHGCGNGGIYHPPGSAPNGLPTWVKLGSYWVGEQAGQGQPGWGEYKYFKTSTSTVTDNHDDPWQSSLSVAIEIWPWKMNYGGIR